MFNKKKGTIFIIVGVIMLFSGLIMSNVVPDDTMASRLCSIVFGLGGGCIGGGIGELYKINKIHKTPGKSKELEIEYKDERNMLIRQKAMAVSGDITNWFVLLLSYISIVMDYPLWFTFLILGIFISKHIISLFLMTKYNKEL